MALHWLRSLWHWLALPIVPHWSIVAATATVTVGNDCGKAGRMTIAERVALLFFAAVFSVAVGASIDGGLRSLLHRCTCLTLS